MSMTSTAHRAQKMRSHRIKTTKPESLWAIPIRPIRATFPDPARGRSMVALESDVAPASVFLVGRRPPLSEHPFVWRWLARFIYRRIRWVPDHGIEYQGVYSDEAEARWAASGPGMFVMEVPLNASLPLETCQFGAHDFPLSEASHEYRNRKFPFVAVPRSQIERLHEKVRSTDPIIKEMRAKAV
jgi:hypothetical protein